ncbi:hypothetical protein [Roseivirga sp.]|uniref:hypothetical protein n=1 Tax=Roseivirga sp. TaxID=1964215 RepID=UPI003B52BA28
MSINVRITEIIKAFGDSESGFAKRLGVSSSVMFNIVNPKGRMSYPSGPVLEKLLALELDGKQVSAEWLMRGRGEMFSEGASIATPEEALEFLKQSIEALRKNH